LAEEKAATPEEKKVVTEEETANSEALSQKKPATKKETTKATKPEVVHAKKGKTPETKILPVNKKSAPAKKTEEVEPKVAKPRKEWTGNPMLRPRIEKVTINMSVGKSGQPLEQAVTILKRLTDQKPSKRAAKKTIREFGIRKGESIACVVTLRKEKAEKFLRKAFQAVENKLSKYCFDRQGNFSFGIKEHIDIPGTKYMPSLGIHGMDVSVSLGRPGYRVKRRHRAKSKIGKDHLLTADEAKLFIKDEFDVEII
jgi:large subunit ribosomal protein L5